MRFLWDAEELTEAFLALWRGEADVPQEVREP